jgi:hypothetical protein
MSNIKGTLVQGDVQYLQVTMPPGGPHQYRYVPLKAPNGQELGKVVQQAPPPAPAPAPMQQPMQPQYTQQAQPQVYQQPMAPPVTYVQQPVAPPVTYVQPQPQVTYVQPNPAQYQQVMYNDINRVQQGYGQPGYPPQGGYNQYGGPPHGMYHGKKMKKMKKKGGYYY